MSFSVDQYIDDQFLFYQDFIGKLSHSTPIIDFSEVDDEDKLIRVLVDQNKAYAKKIVDLFEELANDAPANGQHSEKSETTAGTKPRQDEDHLIEREDPSHLEQKVDYLNKLFMQTKKQNEEKEGVIKDLSAKYDALKAQVGSLTDEKDRFEKDLEELMEEFLIVKKKYDDASSVVKDKDRLINELSRRVGKETPRTANEPEHIPELNEEIEELKEKLEQKEKIVKELKTTVDSLNASAKLPPKGEDLSLLHARILDLGFRLRELRAIVVNLSAKSEVRVEDRVPSGPATKSEKADQDELIDMIDNYHLVLLESVKKAAVNLLNLPVPEPVVAPASVRETERERRSAVESDRRSIPNNTDSRSQPASPERKSHFEVERRRLSVKTNQFREDLEHSKEELEEKLKLSMKALANTNESELVNHLQKEIEKNQLLKEKIEKLSYTFHKVMLNVQEDLERLSLVQEYARRTVTAEDLRHQILACKNKVSEMLNPDLIDNLTLNEEYEQQRKLWQEKISQQASRFDEELTRLREELENQKKATLEQEEALNEQLKGVTRDYEELQRQYQEEVDKFAEKVEYLEQEHDILNKYVEELKKAKADLQDVVSEREETILAYTNKVAEWQAKCSYVESDIRKTMNEKNRLQDQLFEREKEIEVLKDDRLDLQTELKSLRNSVENLEKSQRLSDQDNSLKSSRILELEAVLDSDRKRLRELNEHIKAEYSAYVEETERNTEQLKDNYDRLISEYNAQIDDLRRYSDQLRRTHESQTDANTTEIRKLTQISEDAQETVRNQAEALRVKDDKIGRLSEEVRSLEFKVRTMEDNLNEMNAVKEKNKRYFDLLTMSNNELSSIKVEIQGLIHERNEALDKSNKVEKAYIDIREELRRAVEKNERSREMIQEQQNEFKSLKDELDRSHKKVLDKERELKNLNEEYTVQARQTNNFKDDAINRLRDDLRQVTRDYENIRKEYQIIIERNEETLYENEKLKRIALDKEVNFNEIEKLNNLNDELLIQNEQLKAEKRRNDEDHERERRNLASEVNSLKNKIFDLQSSAQRRLK